MEDEEDAGELGRPLMRSDVVFDAGGEEQPRNPRPPMHTDMPRAVQAAQERDDEDLWAAIHIIIQSCAFLFTDNSRHSHELHGRHCGSKNHTHFKNLGHPLSFH